MLRVIRCTNISLKAVTLKGSGTAENDVCLNPPVGFRFLVCLFIFNSRYFQGSNSPQTRAGLETNNGQLATDK